MKITLNNRPLFLQQGENLKPPATERGVQKTSGKFDEIHIQQTQSAALPDDKFVSVLKDKLMAEITRPTSAKQLDTIKNQIQSNTYPLNLEEVAKRILLT